MLLGKRPRPPMRRTTSMAGFAADLGATEAPQTPDQEKVHQILHQNRKDRQRASKAATAGGSARRQGAQLLESSYASAVASPLVGGRRISGDFAVVETAAFLTACGLCKRHLGPGRDTFIYRGEIAFCSLECRQQQMSLDERNEKCWLTSMKKDAPPVAPAGSEASGSGEMVAAA